MVNAAEMNTLTYLNLSAVAENWVFGKNIVILN